MLATNHRNSPPNFSAQTGLLSVGCEACPDVRLGQNDLGTIDSSRGLLDTSRETALLDLRARATAALKVAVSGFTPKLELGE
jgi:hypothetical protein